MCLVNDDCEGTVLVCRRYVVQNELELMDDGNDDFLALVQQGMQIRRRLCPAYSGRYLCELLYRVFYLLVEVDTVGNHNNSIKDILAIVLKRNKLVGKPSNRVRFSTASTMLNKVTLPGALLLGAIEEHRHSLQLVVSWKNLLICGFPSILVLIGDNLDIVLQNLRELIFR